VPDEQISVADSGDFSGARFMESFESKHSDHDFTGRLSDAVGITAPPLRLDSQAKYGGVPISACPKPSWWHQENIAQCCAQAQRPAQPVCLWAGVQSATLATTCRSPQSNAYVCPDLSPPASDG
jgi:hypothetical protein